MLLRVGVRPGTTLKGAITQRTAESGAYRNRPSTLIELCLKPEQLPTLQFYQPTHSFYLNQFVHQRVLAEMGAYMCLPVIGLM